MKKNVVVLVVLFLILFVLSACAENSDLVSSEQIDVQEMVFGKSEEQAPVELPEAYILFHKEFGGLYQFYVYQNGEEVCSSNSVGFTDPRQWLEKAQGFYITPGGCPGLSENLIFWDIENHYADGWKIYFQVEEGELYPET